MGVGADQAVASASSRAVRTIASRAEAIEWAKRCPGSDNETIEIRQVQEMQDFPEDVRKAASGLESLQGR